MHGGKPRVFPFLPFFPSLSGGSSGGTYMYVCVHVRMCVSAQARPDLVVEGRGEEWLCQLVAPFMVALPVQCTYRPIHRHHIETALKQESNNDPCHLCHTTDSN